MTPGQRYANAWITAWQHANSCPVCQLPGEDAWAGCHTGRALDDALIRSYHSSPRRVPQPAGGAQ